eukprot:1115329-Pyramimonas_sp.AAC.1
MRAERYNRVIRTGPQEGGALQSRNAHRTSRGRSVTLLSRVRGRERARHPISSSPKVDLNTDYRPRIKACST